MGRGSDTLSPCNTWSQVVLVDDATINASGGTIPNSLAIVRNNAIPTGNQAGPDGWVIIQDVHGAWWNTSGYCAVHDPRDMNATLCCQEAIPARLS
jgi:hypothetical protein